MVWSLLNYKLQGWHASVGPFLLPFRHTFWDSIKLSAISVDEEKRVRCNKEKTPLGNEVDGLAQVFMVLSKRVVGAFQKNRRFSAKESTVLSKRIVDAKRKQSIYSQKSLNCYAVEDSNTGPKHSKIIVFITWGSWNFLSVAFLSLWIHLEKHSRVRRIPKRSLLFRWESIPLWGFL